jgi:cyclophilin family peptidyl-prolyl cis-trans isomerase
MWRLDYPGFGVTPQLLTLFGQVISGLEVVDAIAHVETIPPNIPLEDIVILSITLGAYE